MSAHKQGVEDTKHHRIRMTLTSSFPKKLEKVCAEILGNAKGKNINVKGPVRMPTRNLKITTRKTPCGEGSKTWDRYSLRIHKRLIDFVATSAHVRDITHINIDPDVNFEVTIAS
ncbi:ribosomal protein S20 [Salpingoeca rosetta]|uniref:Small ribosomal subunit protein uS10 n=1 Tax=Salpingoeca rosetta (strain ATCC 50818 / BSB-021) TaxID=946362 RepID=F2U4A9_SALR5|nr:ribosomal protein S20 [Salpingoeca rosetta]EGD82475.1 ribosomal protein S20 [Salpingoeca rosetta]|eukprot:XP_004995711.1 ribosomal protein S20 [Salpingoeca rosetta]